MSERTATSDRMRECTSSSRRGMLYVAVLGVAIIISMMGFAALHLARTNVRSVVRSSDLTTARLLAAASAEHAITVLDIDSNWRTNYTHDEEAPLLTTTIGGLPIAWKLVDADGDLADDDSDWVTVVGIGRVGDATYFESVTLEPAGTGLTCLEVSLHADNQIHFNNSVFNNDQIISANNTVHAEGSSVFGAVEAVSAITGNTYMGTTTTGITPRDMPDTSTVFNFYLANGTLIDPAPGGGDVKLDKVLLSANNNPFGAVTNPMGIYVIDCQGEKFVVKDSRIEATLVVLSPAVDSKIEGQIHWEPAIANFPALILDGNLEFDWKGDENLDEAAVGMNFNPPGTPFHGIEDSDAFDEYPPLIKGLVYVTGTLYITNECKLEGSIVAGGTIDIDDNVDVEYDSIHFDTPPPGFVGGGSDMKVVPGTWTRVVSDLPPAGAQQGSSGSGASQQSESGGGGSWIGGLLGG